MRKRLRKKLRLGEFRKYCFPVYFRIDGNLCEVEREKVIDRFIDMIEGAGLQFGGVGNTEWSGIVELCGRGTVTEHHQMIVLDWLRAQREIEEPSVGPLKDAWHG